MQLSTPERNGGAPQAQAPNSSPPNEPPRYILTHSVATGTGDQFTVGDADAAGLANTLGEASSRPGTYLLRQSNVLLNDSVPSLYEKAFPDVFPYGHGGPSAQRHTHVARDTCLQHYLRTGRHAIVDNAKFIAAVFDITNR